MIRLNPQQLEAAQHYQGPILIFAGAGSGKTRVIVHRICHLIQDRSVAPWNILAVTFTNRAANEMKERIAGVLNPVIAGKIHIGTFHSICARILRMEAETLGISTQFTISDDAEQISRLKRAIREVNAPEKIVDPRYCSEQISLAKNRSEKPADLMRDSEYDIRKKWLARVYDRYEQQLRSDQALDFDDLILRTVELFRDDPKTLDRYQEKYRFILVDEYQDTNQVQFELVSLLARRHGNLMVVGDDDQSIYRWRGADFRNILNFADQFPGCKEIKLEQNYRSTQIILAAASELMSNNVHRAPKRLWSNIEGGEKIRVIRLDTDRQEAEYIGRLFKRLHEEEDMPFSNMAVFYRTNAQSRVLEECFISRQIPHRVIGNISFFKRKEVKDLLAYIRLILNPDDSEACLRIINVPRRGVGRKTIETIQTLARKQDISFFAAIEKSLETSMFSGFKLEKIQSFVALINTLVRIARTKSVPEFVSAMISQSGYSDMYVSMDTNDAKGSLEIIDDFAGSAQDFYSLTHGDLSEFADYLALNEQADESGENADPLETVSLMTLHNAKGLEFPVVVMSGMDERFCPYSHGGPDLDPEELEEERRLVYVGITRAKSSLYLTGCRIRRLYGKELQLAPSRFISEIPDEYLDHATPGPSHSTALDYTRNVSPQAVYRSTPSSSGQHIQQGDRVRHPLWGLGLVLNIQGAGPSAKIKISFDRAGVKKLKLTMANITKLN